MKEPKTKQLHRKSRFRRQARLFLGIAVLFICLGLGNLIYGSYKTDHYETLLREATTNPEVAEGVLESRSKNDESMHTEEAASSSELISSKLGELTYSPSASQAKLNKINARLNYYRMSVLGGKWFLALAGALLLMTLVSLKFVDQQER